MKAAFQYFYIFSWILSFHSLALGTDIGTFADKTCSRSLENLRGPNGYPDGYCTPLNLNETQSFQIVGLDKGCAVTIYGSDETSPDPCSLNSHQIVAEIARCYNSTWIYYSIDGCDIPVSIPPASSSSTEQPTSAPTSSTAALPPAPAPPRRTGALVGGIVGGVVGLALIIVAVVMLFRHRQRNNRPLPPLPAEPTPNVQEIQPRKSPEKGPDYELYAHETAVELGRNSMYLGEAAELSGDPGRVEGQMTDKKSST